MNENWLKLQQISDQASINLVCLPFAGGYAEYYLPWRKYMPSDFALYPVQLPGRSYLWQLPAFTHIEELIKTLLKNLHHVVTQKPFIIFGHSMGGYIAYELCKGLAKLQLPLPLLLVVSAVPAPIHWHSRKLLSQLEQQDFNDFFYTLGGIDPDFLQHKSFFDMQMELLRKDLILCESCHYQSPASLPIPILAMGGNEDNYVSIESLQGWGLETSDNFFFEEFSGNHFFLKEYASSLLATIKLKVGSC